MAVRGRSAEPVPLDTAGLADSRVRFLTREPAEPRLVRPTILASWHRSRGLDVAADKVESPFAGDCDFETPLVLSAQPILQRLQMQLAGQAVSIVLTDPSGLVLVRRTGDDGLARHLDTVNLAPGFNYAEQFVGTNGIGTALEAGSPTQVYGHEHYAENLEDLACAGVPIHDPVSGRLLGLLDLTCWRREASPLLLTLAASTAAQIEQALLHGSGLRELQVLHAYRQSCRRSTGIVFAMTGGSVMLNDHARSDLDWTDRDILLARAGETAAELAPGRRRSVAVPLPSGSVARMYCQQVPYGDEAAGLVVNVRVSEADEVTDTGSAWRPSAGPRMLLPGLIGTAPLWQQVCRDVERALTARRWLAVEGEPGVGKQALLRAVQLRQVPQRRFLVFDAAQAAQDKDWAAALRRGLCEVDTVIIAHAERLEPRTRRVVAAALQEVRQASGREQLWVALTFESGSAPDQLLATIPSTVTVPPLRLRLDDVPALVSFFLAKLGHGGHISCSSEAMRLLMRSSWPENIRQLEHLLQQVVQHRRSGAIGPDDLPPELHAISRRVLTPLESMERDAIVRALVVTDGNKVRAARSLGMSRATIYRKIREYGIVTAG